MRKPSPSLYAERPLVRLPGGMHATEKKKKKKSPRTGATGTAAETETSKNPLQSGQRHSARPGIQAGRISPLSPPSEVSDILNASGRLNSPARSESSQKKGEREREERTQVGYYRAGPFLSEKELSRSTIGRSGPREEDNAREPERTPPGTRGWAP